MVLLASTSTSTYNSPTLNIKTTPNRTRPPLLASEPDNNYNNGAPKSREVTSRYLSTSSASSTKEKNSKRVESTERRRLVTPSKADRMLIDSEAKKKTTRSLSVSFQVEAFPFRVNKAKKKPSPSPSAVGARGGTPEWKRSATPKRVAEQHRLPGRSRPEVALSGRADDGIVRCEDLICSDAESVSSGGRRGIVVPARFWQETTGSPIPRIGPPKKLGIESPGCSPRGVANRRGQLCPTRGGFVRPARGVGNNGVVGGVMSDSILCFVGDVRRGKVSENRIVEVHLLRILYNRLLQWRFVNARAYSALSFQRLSAEKSLYNALITTSKLLDSVRAKRSVLLQLRQNLKLVSILKRQMLYLDELELIEQDYSRSLSGAVEALRASTLRLPVVCGAVADVQNVKDAISSAVDVLQAMASSTRVLLAKVAEANSLVSELANVIKKEGALLNHCKDLLSSFSSMKVKEYSLRTHILQLKRAPMELKAEA